MKDKRSKRPSSSASAASLLPHSILQTNFTSLGEATERISRLGVTEVDNDSDNSAVGRAPWVDKGLQCIRYLLKKDTNTRQKKLVELKTIIQAVDANECKSAANCRELLEAFSRVVERLLLLEKEPRIRIAALEVIDVMFEKFRQGTVPFLDKIIPTLLSLRTDSQRDVAKKAKEIYFSHFSTEAKRTKLISHIALSIGRFFKQYCKDFAEEQGKVADRKEGNDTVERALGCLYAVLEDLLEDSQDELWFEDWIGKLLDVTLLQRLIEHSKNADWKPTLLDLVAVCFRLTQRVANGQFLRHITSTSFVRSVLSAVLCENVEPTLGKSIVLIQCLLVVHLKKQVLDPTDIKKIVVWTCERVLKSNRILVQYVRLLSVMFKDLFEMIDEDDAERLLVEIETRLGDCVNSTNWQREEQASSVISLYLDCVFSRAMKHMASDVMIDEEQLTKHLKAFWDNILFCKIPSHQLLPDFVLEQLCRLACNSWTREHFKNSLSSSIDDSISSLEDHSLSSMEKLEKIGIFFYRNCSGAETLILDKFQSFMERNSSEKFPLKLRILELFCKLNDNAYDDFVAKQIVLFTSNTSISENKQLNGLLLSCIEHYISWTEINRSSFICCKLIPHCSSDLFNLVFVSLMRRLNSSVILELLQDSDFENRTLSSVRNVLRKAGAVEQEERQFVDTFVRVWMEYNQPLSDTPSLLQAVLENGEFFNSKPELLRNYLLLLAKNTPDQFDMVKLWVSVAMSYLPILKDWFLSHIWNHIVETCWSMDAKDLANSEFCAKFPRLLETLSNTDDAIQYANLYKSSFCSVQFTSRSSESISDFILELESALCEDSRVKSSVTLTFVRFLTAPEVLKGFSVLGIERVGEFLGCVLLHVENDSETFGDLVGSVKQYLNGLSYNEMEDLVFHIFRSAFNRLRVRIEDVEPLHSLQEILCSAMEALSLSSQETGKKIGYDLIENKKFLLDEFCFFILFHVSNLNVDNNPFTLLQMILERLISELVFLYNSDDDNNILVHFDEQSSKARLRAILICKRLFLSNAQSLQTRWASFAADIINGVRKLELRRSQRLQQENSSSGFIWSKEELGYTLHAMEGLFLFALGQNFIWHNLELIVFIKNVAEGALEEMHDILVARESIDKDYFLVSCAACSLLLELNASHKSNFGSLPEMEISHKLALFALDILLHVVIDKPMLQDNPAINSIAKLTRTDTLPILTDVPLILRCFNLLESSNPEIRLTGYTLLAGHNPYYLFANVCESEEETVTWFNQDVEKLLELPLDIGWYEELDELLKYPSASVAFLGNQTCVLLRYFLTWIIFLNYKGQENLEFSRIFSEYLREHFQLFENFMTFIAECSVFRMYSFSKQLQNIVAESATSSCKEYYLDVSELLEHVYDIDVWISCCAKAFGLCLAQLPALSRRWYNDSLSNDRRVKVESFVRKHISSSIIEKEFNLLQMAFDASQESVGNLQLKPVNVTREVIAVYSFTDTRIEIVLKLPEEFPLSLVTVEPRTAIGMTEAKWRKTVLAMSTLLAMKDGNLRDAIDLWRRNLDRQFEGVEECPICYSILHVSNGTLPRLECVTCKHKFHAACLYKWLQSSATSSCPLCRTVGRFFK